ncbi:MAG TPA: hypothetical protein VNH44_03700 [Micropepsaceae bacterium]|nr:hypothetical protein [Micropepsaceae bacterium]
MKRATIFALTALLCTSAAAPSFAAMERLGWVDFSQRDTHDSRLGNFKADSMALIARDSDVRCDSVVATFGDGRTREIFRGELLQGEPMRIGLPQRSVDRVDFDCHPTDRGRASVEIAADTGGFPDDGRYDRPFDRYDDRP